MFTIFIERMDTERVRLDSSLSLVLAPPCCSGLLLDPWQTNSEKLLSIFLIIFPLFVKE